MSKYQHAFRMAWQRAHQEIGEERALSAQVVEVAAKALCDALSIWRQHHAEDDDDGELPGERNDAEKLCLKFIKANAELGEACVDLLVENRELKERLDAHKGPSCDVDHSA